MTTKKKLLQIWILLFTSSTVFANVTIVLDDVAVNGYTEDIIVPVTLINPTHTVGGFQFDLIAIPSLVTLFDATPLDEDNYSADFNVLDDGSNRIVFYSNSGDGFSIGGDEIVLNLHFNGENVLSALIALYAYDLTVSDEDGNLISGEIIDGSITIGNVVSVSASSDTGDVSENVYIDISIENSGLVGGLQFDIFDTPNYLDVTSFSTTERSAGFTIDYNELENGVTRVIMYNAENQNIQSGTGPIANMEMIVHENAYNSNVGVNFENITITDDIGGTYWIATADSGTVTVSPGYIEEPHNLQAQGGQDGYVVLNWEAPYGPIPEDFSEDFEEGIVPDDWTLTTNSSQGWFITQDGSSSFWTIPGHTWYMCANDDMADDDGSVDYLIAPSLNVSGAEVITLNFASYFDGAYGHSASIEVSIDGVNFEEVISLDPVSEWITETVDLSDYAGSSNLYIAFHSNDNGFWASGWAVDDIFVTFAARQINREVHYRLTERGIWVLEASKDEVLSEFGGGIPYKQKVDLTEPIINYNRPVDLDAFKIYRSLISNSNFEEIAEVSGNVTTYLDEDVLNSTTYYYYVTAIYPDGSESGATSIVSATPVEWVELSMDNGSSLSGQSDTLNFYINNESDLALFYFEILDYPDVINSLNIIPTERTSNWALEIADQGDGTIAISGISVGTPLTPGNGSVCQVVLYPVADEEMTVNLSYTAGTAIQDDGYVDLNWTAEGGTYDVGIETQYLNLFGGYGLSGEETVGSVFLQSTQPIHAIQFDIMADPPFINGIDLSFNEQISLQDWSYSGVDLGIGYRITAYDNSLANPIEAGIRHFADITYEILPGIPDSTIIDITVSDPVLADINNLPMHTESTPHAFYVGQPPVGCTIENVTGQLIPGGIGAFEVHMQNTETVNILEFEILDMPNYMTVTNISLLDRFDDGTMDGISGEAEDGSFYFLGYDFSTFIEPGSGPVMEVEVQFNNSLINPSVVFIWNSISAGDINALPIPALADNFGQFNSEMVAVDTDHMPISFNLFPNFPNPFNPSTVITYDLAENTDVEIQIFDMKGRLVNSLVNKIQNSGRHYVTWNGKDFSGTNVSAGIYIYQLKAGDNIFSRKMVLMK